MGIFPPYSNVVGVLLAAGLAGLLLVPQRAGLALLLHAWWGGTLLSFGLLLVARQGVRWDLFLFPALCLGAGVALAHLWRRGAAGRVVASAALLVPLAHGVLLWLTRLHDYLH